MASLDTLPPDQRAVLNLVLQRGRSYDDIAGLLAIDRAAVRGRALAALDQLGPDTAVPPERRALLADYLLGQLPEALAGQTRERLSESSSEQAWARALASELGSVASTPLPEIPTQNSAAPAMGTASASGGPGRTGSRPDERPSSRRGGAIMLAIGALVVVAVVVVLLTLTAGASKKRTSTAAGSASRPSTTASSATSTATAHAVAQINLNPPSGSSPAKGIAVVVQDGSAYGIVLEAQHVARNNHNAYAVWLSNSPADSMRLGFVSPAVGKSGQLEVGSTLPANAGHYQKLLLTLETQSAPKTPGAIVLAGPFKGVPAS
jgi:hypothetical protein